MPLTEMQARKAVPGDRDYKLFDSGGLYLFVTTKGHKSWRLKYRFGGKERCLVYGVYPEVSLARAREERDRARLLLREHRDPSTERRKQRMAAHSAAGETFKRIGIRWHQAQTARWSPLQGTKVRQALERDVYPEIGALPLTDVDGPTVLRMLRKVEARGAIDTAKRIRQHVSAIFVMAMAEGLCAQDPAGPNLVKALLPTPRGGKQPAVRDIADARRLLVDMEASTSGSLVKLASRLLALTVVRPGIVRAAVWSEFEGVDWADPLADASRAAWRIPPERMKLDQESKGDEAFEHVVPLPGAAVEVLRAVHQLTGSIAFLFPSVRSTKSPMSENTIGYMYARNGYSGRHVPHGWRATFSTIMNERAVVARRPDDRAIIDGMLAHKAKGVSASEMAYNRALHWDRRREIADEWAALLMEGMVPAAELVRGLDR